MRIMPGMRFDDVLKALEAHKGDGTWAVVADKAGVHYDTIARIARGKLKSPSVQAVERISAALEQIAADKARAITDTTYRESGAGCG